MNRSRRFGPRNRQADPNAQLAAYRGKIVFKDPGTNEELILSPGGEIRDKAGNMMYYDGEGRLKRKQG